MASDTQIPTMGCSIAEAKAILAPSDNKIPARIHAILAREAHKAVVFRRGPILRKL